MPKPLQFENNNTAITWRVPHELRDTLSEGDFIFEKLEDDFEYHYDLLERAKGEDYINDINGRKYEVDKYFEGTVWELSLNFATNYGKVFVEMYEALKNGYGVTANPMLADLILGVGVEFENKKATKIAEQVALKIEDQLEISALELVVLIAKIGNNLPNKLTQGDAMACLIRVDQEIKQELIKLSGDENVLSLIDCLSKNPVNALLSHYYQGGYVEITSEEVHIFQDTGLLGNAGFFSKFCCFSGADA